MLVDVGSVFQYFNINPLRGTRSPCLGKSTAATVRAVLPTLTSVCSIPCIQTMAWRPATEHGQWANTVRESTLKMDSWREKNFPHRGIKPASVLLPSFGSDTLPTELFRPSFNSLSGSSWILTPRQPHYGSPVEN